LSLFGLELK